VLVGVFFVGAASADSANRDTSPPWTLEELRAFFRTTRERIRSMDVCYRIETKVDPKPQNLIMFDERTIRLDLQGGRYRCLRRHLQPGDKEPFETVIAWDSSTESVYRPSHSEGQLNDAPEYLKESTVRLNRVMSLALLQSPRPDGIGLDDWSIESFCRDAEVRNAVETFNGYRCTVTDSYQTERGGERIRVATLWFDVERRGVVDRIVSYKHQRVMDEWLCQEAQQFPADGVNVWLPIRIKGVGRAFTDRVVTQFITVDAKATKLNPATSDSDFQVDFPAGTRVTDKVTGRTFVVGGEERRGPTDRYYGLRPSPNHLTGWLFLAVNLCVVTALVIIGVMRRRRRRSP